MKAGNENGFSLLEALISSTIFFVIVSGVMISYSPSRVIYVQAEARLDIQQNVRLAVSDMAREIRMAGYFPENFAAPPASPLLADAIRVGTDTSLAIYGDADNGGFSSIYFYCLDGELLRRNQGPVDDDASYVCANGAVLAENVTSLRFSYYDANNDPIPNPMTSPLSLDSQGPGSAPDMTDTTQRSGVNRVVMVLTAQDEAAMEEQLFTLSSDVVLRNN